MSSRQTTDDLPCFYTRTVVEVPQETSETTSYPFTASYDTVEEKMSVRGGYVSTELNNRGTLIADKDPTTGVYAYLKIVQDDAGAATAITIEVEAAAKPVIEENGTYVTASWILLAYWDAGSESVIQVIHGNLLLTLWAVTGFAALRPEIQTII